MAKMVTLRISQTSSLSSLPEYNHHGSDQGTSGHKGQDERKVQNIHYVSHSFNNLIHNSCLARCRVSGSKGSFQGFTKRFFKIALPKFGVK